ncbi:unnamed protein product, partial [Ectocarpus sp. 12 AP-2014]
MSNVSHLFRRWGRNEPEGSKTVTLVEEGRQAESQATARSMLEWCRRSSGGSGPGAGVRAQSGSREQVREGQDDEGHPGCQDRHHRHRCSTCCTHSDLWYASREHLPFVGCFSRAIPSRNALHRASGVAALVSMLCCL